MNKTLLFSAVAFAITFLSLNCGAEAKDLQQATSDQSWTSEADERIKIEREKLDFEKSNEDRKAKYELIKAAITGISLLIPLLLGIYTVRSQIKSSYDLKRIEAEKDFALKAADIVMNAKNPFGVRQRAQVLLDLFPSRLPKDFVASFDPKRHIKIGPSTESKMELLKLIVVNPDKEEDIVQLWRRMFPGDPLEKLFPGDYGQANKT
jgi:hypothetical protein